ncbi:hypothetical protein TPA4_71 [Tsukamurella phage TPA4]|uniref:hypothetical protein n=1 Tax=Tsukamurella phage TPA4 TaxID=1647476 RepID=UPI0007B623B3|nr:hypothetical protein BH784_gp71 [Tsukamurella phage TPA4]AKJ72236.1 hypothetical protein TPA4_71 [Tsukamurella phage TPA4]
MTTRLTNREARYLRERMAAAHHGPRTGRPAKPAQYRSTAGLDAANQLRHQTGTARQVEAATTILNTPGLIDWMPPSHRAVLELRVAHPDATLAELALAGRCSKDTVAGQLRRALAALDRKAAAS